MSRFLMLACLCALPSCVFASGPKTLREAYAGDFLLGVALSGSQVDGRDAKSGAIAAREFSSVTAENDMKWGLIQPREGRYDFRASDRYLEFARANNQVMIGHTLVWHSQAPDWLFVGPDGKPASREVLLARMRDHIMTVVGRYKGRIKGWDVVNEAIADGGPQGLRPSPWLQIIGDDYLDHAFRYAREADPKAELYYNDYGLENPGKRKHAVELLRGMLARGVPVDGVGLQGHYGLTWPDLAEVDRTIAEFAALGLKVMITELDVDVLPSKGAAGVADISRVEKGGSAQNPYSKGLPDNVQRRLAERYADFFGIFLKHRDVITRVTIWGLHDGQSWLNDFPIRHRTNYPLLFDRELKPKPAYDAVLKKARAGADAGRQGES